MTQSTLIGNLACKVYHHDKDTSEAYMDSLLFINAIVIKEKIKPKRSTSLMWYKINRSHLGVNTT